MPKALHKNKWRDVKGIEKCEDGFTYQLDGVDGKVYHSEIDDLDLSKEDTHEITNPDGSITRGPGKEPLRKPLKKSIIERWELLKAQISHEMAFMPMREQDEDSEGSPAGGQISDGGDTAQDSGGKEIDEGALQQPIGDPDAEDKSDAVDISSLQGDQGADADAQKTAPDQEESGQNTDEYDEEKLIELLRQEGYSDSEIAYIVHNHTPGGGDHEARAMDLDQQRDQEKHDHHMDRMKGQTDVQTDHAKRMADLEYEHAKREKELRIQHLEEELKTKLEHLKNKGKTDGKAN
jgi:hypothetical protein